MGGVTDDLLVWLLARADERPDSYRYPASAEINTRDRALVAGLNSVAEARGLPPITPTGEGLAGPTGPSPPSDDLAQGHGPLRADLLEIPAGEAGLAQSIRAWRKRPYTPDGPCWDSADFGEEITSRLIGLAEAGRLWDAVHYLRLLADASWSSEGAALLRDIADGLEQGDHLRLAAVAHTLAWTRAGGYGYSGFGGDIGVSSLRRASDLDQELTLKIVAAETESVVAAAKYGTYGFSKTLIHAFGVRALGSINASPLDVAFAAWREIRSVTDYRAPRVHDSDDPAGTYVPNSDDADEVSPAEMDDAFALGIFAGLGHASREKKRRTMLAIELMLSERPTQVATATDLALNELSDPATLTWLLRLIEEAGTSAAPVVTACRQTLVRLAGKEHLVAGTLARRLLQGESLLVPLPTAARKLLPDSDADACIPDHEQGREADEMVQVVAGNRLRSTETTLPNLRSAVVSRVADAVASDDYRIRLHRQLDHFASRNDQHLPDAYLYCEQTVEEALQRAASAGSAERVRMGEASDLAVWEDRLASLLLDDPKGPLALEARRVPRPALPAPPEPGTDRWDGEATSGTLSVECANTAWAESLVQVRGWPLIATVERQMFQHPEKFDRHEVAVMRHRVPEFRDVAGTSRVESLPAAGDMGQWMEEEQSGVVSLDRAMPICGLDINGEYLGDGVQGLGAQTHLLTPTSVLRMMLGLRPGKPYELIDSHSGGIALITWRTSYDDGAFSLERPRLIGSGVTAHPELVQRLIAVKGRLVIRDFVAEVPLNSATRYHDA